MRDDCCFKHSRDCARFWDDLMFCRRRHRDCDECRCRRRHDCDCDECRRKRRHDCNCDKCRDW
ncbi:hypothetical protein COI93_00775 [Bacillus cereus]|uniref:Uncharacterized protein n=1 Tax=Bacillus cereus TaxID=1396 RepID=A0A2B0MSP1_BACCE|nr:hypothetical protein COI93_00775 [Bacillus cereus]